MRYIRLKLFRICRFLVQCILFFLEGFIYVCEQIAHWILTLFKKPEYVRVGGCKNTGQCCRAIGIEFPKFWHRHPKLINLAKKVASLALQFSLLGCAKKYAGL